MAFTLVPQAQVKKTSALSLSICASHDNLVLDGTTPETHDNGQFLYCWDKSDVYKEEVGVF
jgi:hypothetical protein